MIQSLMKINLLKKVWKFLDQLGTQTKTIIIIGLLGWCLGNYIISENKNSLKYYTEQLESERQEAEQYTLKMAPEIDRCVQAILDKDIDASNVILISYHNSTKSLQGFSYQYLNCLTEKTRGIDAIITKPEWHELEYIYYIDELQKINSYSVVRIDDIETMRNNMPKFYLKLKTSECKSVAFYPITGSSSPIGMIIILYRNPKIYCTSYYPKVLGPEISKLSAILDYDNIKKMMHE